MRDLEETQSEDLEPYEPGIERSEIVQATLFRFMPASVLSAFAAIAGIAVLSDSTIPEEIIFLPLMAAPLGAGFGVGLEVLRRFLYPDANLNGRRSVIAGIMSPFAYGMIMLLAIQLFFDGRAGVVTAVVGVSALFLAGVVSAVIMFFAWLTPPPEEMRPDALNPRACPSTQPTRQP